MAVVPRLPVLVGGQSDHPEWRKYLAWVYGEAEIPRGKSVDLNTFAWFYHQAPLKVEVLDRVNLMGELPVDTAWTCRIPFLPECEFSPYGFFVTRDQARPSLDAWKQLDRLEVLRVKFAEKGAAWFYYAVGSGIFLNLRALPVAGEMKVIIGALPDLGIYDQGVYEYMLRDNCNILISANRFSDRRVEVVVRSSSATADLNSACPLDASVFSTGLFERASCVCSANGRLPLLNCRREVARTLMTERPLDDAAFYVQVGSVAAFLLVLLVLCLVAMRLQSRGR